MEGNALVSGRCNGASGGTPVREAGPACLSKRVLIVSIPTLGLRTMNPRCRPGFRCRRKSLANMLLHQVMAALRQFTSSVTGRPSYHNSPYRLRFFFAEHENRAKTRARPISRPQPPSGQLDALPSGSGSTNPESIRPHLRAGRAPPTGINTTYCRQTKYSQSCHHDSGRRPSGTPLAQSATGPPCATPRFFTEFQRRLTK